MQDGWVYIMTNRTSGTLYGVTTDLYAAYGHREGVAHEIGLLLQPGERTGHWGCHGTVAMGEARA
jgi:hypothetical protein